MGSPNIEKAVVASLPYEEISFVAWSLRAWVYAIWGQCRGGVLLASSAFELPSYMQQSDIRSIQSLTEIDFGQYPRRMHSQPRRDVQLITISTAHRYLGQ